MIRPPQPRIRIGEDRLTRKAPRLSEALLADGEQFELLARDCVPEAGRAVAAGRDNLPAIAGETR